MCLVRNLLFFTFTGAVTLGLAVNPVSGTLSGTLTRNAIAGIATFPGLALDGAGAGYVLVAVVGLRSCRLCCLRCLWQ